jgi:hypothetical protein
MKTMSKSEENGVYGKKKNGSRFETKTEHIDDSLKIAHQKSQTCDEDDTFELALAEEEAEEKEPDSKFVQILRKASTHMAWDLVFILLTFYALFVPDIVKMQ